ncbi:MAG: NfeD family protein [Gammaproteobacteria bacterium]
MRSIVVRVLAAALLMLGALPAGAATAAPAAATAPRLLAIDGAIGPPMADYVVRALGAAEKADAPFVVIRLDTPGGLSDSMRTIIKAILASPIPVVCWVGPEGARAASAGTYILYACGLATMAPGTNVGAATPISLSPTGGSSTPAKPKTAEGKKVLNDAIAYIRSLAQLHGRNADWAEKAVRDGASLTAEDALKQNVVELLAPSLPALLAKLDGRSVPTAKTAITLHTAGATLHAIEPDWRENFLGVITTPTIAYILFIIGIVGLLIEALHPGFILPGTVGAICLIIALFAFHALPINYAGLALIVLGVGLLVAEAFVASFGVLGLGGIAAFVIGSIMLLNTHAPGYSLPRMYIGSIAFVAALALGGMVYFLIRMRRRPVVSGREHMIGRSAVALEDFAETGFVHIEGERWQARTHTPVHKGDTVVVEALNGLILSVRPATTSEEK